MFFFVFLCQLVYNNVVFFFTAEIKFILCYINRQTASAFSSASLPEGGATSSSLGLMMRCCQLFFFIQFCFLIVYLLVRDVGQTILLPVWRGVAQVFFIVFVFARMYHSGPVEVIRWTRRVFQVLLSCWLLVLYDFVLCSHCICTNVSMHE